MTKQEYVDDFCERANCPVGSRAYLLKIAGNMVGSGHVANRDSLGTGSKDKVRLGRRVGYITRSFGFWLADQIDGLED